MTCAPVHCGWWSLLDAIFVAKNPVLTAFASGRATALVIDCGGAGTTVAAVHDGYALQKAVTRSPLGGDVITDVVLKAGGRSSCTASTA